MTLDAGAYNVTESGPSGYTASFSADCSGTIANGETKTCTVTNDDQADADRHQARHQRQRRYSDSGDFTLIPVALTIHRITSRAQNHPALRSHSTPAPTTLPSLDQQATPPASRLTAPAQSPTARPRLHLSPTTISSGKLIVIKHVINDNGGTATAANFTLDSGGSNDSPDNFPGAESPGTWLHSTPVLTTSPSLVQQATPPASRLIARARSPMARPRLALSPTTIRQRS